MRGLMRGPSTGSSLFSQICIACSRALQTAPVSSACLWQRIADAIDVASSLLNYALNASGLHTRCSGDRTRLEHS